MAIVVVNYNAQLNSQESVSSNTTFASSIPTAFSMNSSVIPLTPTSSPAVSAEAFQTFSFTTGAVTIDLTSLTGLNGVSVSMSGLKVRILVIQNPTGNASITVAKGASSGYTGLGSAFSVTIPAGGEFRFYDGGNGTAVSGSVKTLDCTGSGSQTFNVAVIGGA